MYLCSDEGILNSHRKGAASCHHYVTLDSALLLVSLTVLQSWSQSLSPKVLLSHSLTIWVFIVSQSHIQAEPRSQISAISKCLVSDPNASSSTLLELEA